MNSHECNWLHMNAYQFIWMKNNILYYKYISINMNAGECRWLQMNVKNSNKTDNSGWSQMNTDDLDEDED